MLSHQLLKYQSRFAGLFTSGQLRIPGQREYWAYAAFVVPLGCGAALGSATRYETSAPSTSAAIVVAVSAVTVPVSEASVR